MYLASGIYLEFRHFMTAEADLVKRVCFPYMLYMGPIWWDWESYDMYVILRLDVNEGYLFRIGYILEALGKKIFWSNI